MRILKSLEILGKIDPEDTNIYPSNIKDRYENHSDNLHDMCLVDLSASYILIKS